MRNKEKILNDFKICCSNDSCEECSYYIFGACSDSEYNELDKEVIELLESDTEYNKGMEDAWLLIKKMYGMSANEFRQCFNTIDSCEVVRKYTVSEVKTKIEDWQRSQFYIGDIVYSGTNDNKNICGVVINTSKEYLEVLTDNRTIEECLKKDMKKNGKHLDINSLFKQIEELSV